MSSNFPEYQNRIMAVGAITTGVAEAGLHVTQYGTRSAEESMTSVIASGILSGALGSAGQALKNKALRHSLVQKVAAEIEGIPSENTLSAAQVFTTTLDQEELAGLGLINKTLKVFSSGRLAQFPSKMTRQVNQALAENNYTFAKNKQGIASIAAVETKIKRYDALKAAGVGILKKNYTQYKRSPGWRSSKLKKHEFSEQIGYAMRHGDKHPIPEVVQAAQEIRPMLDTLKENMITLGILPEGVDVKTSASYLPRMYKFEKILPDRTGFKQIIGDWLENNNLKASKKVGDRFEANHFINRLLGGFFCLKIRRYEDE